MKRRRVMISTIIMCFVLLFSIVLASTIGSAKLGVGDCFRVIISRLPFFSDFITVDEIKPTYLTIIWNIRIPRVLLSGLSGASLAMVGACFQGLFRNPLADPQIIGVSSGAALGATVAVLCGISISFLGLSGIGFCAFLGALVTVVVVYQIACTNKRSGTVHIILTGTAVSSLLSAVISLLMSLNHEELEKIYMWTLGSFTSATMTKVIFLFCFFVLCAGVLLFFARDLDLILIGEDTALSLGVNTNMIRKVILVACSILVAACVSVCGTIGFVGLIIPHIVRLICGPKNRTLLPLSALSGAIFLIWCDTIARVIRAPGEIPVGVVTALCGAPYFLFLLNQSKKKGV